MRKIFTFLCLAAVSFTSNGQRLFVEDFNYATGQLTDEAGGADVSGGKWKVAGTGSFANFATVVTGNLTYPGYFSSPTATSNQLLLQSTPGGGLQTEDVFANFAAVSTGTIYASALFQLTDITNLGNSTSGGEYFFAFATTASNTAFRARVFVRKGVAANTVQFGIAAFSVSTDIPIMWSPIDRDATQVHLVTTSFQFISGANNDVARLYVDHAVSEPEPVVPDAVSTLVGAEPLDISRIVVRQATTGAPRGSIDAIVVATTYAASLPLNLTSFKAAFNGKTTQVKWTTDNEVNVSGFSVEKSLDGVHFSQVDFVNAKNNGSQNEYALNDTKVKGGTTYYRLKLVDKNGSFKYSAVATIKNSAVIKAEVFPNPTRGNLTVSHSQAEKGAAIRVTNLEGKLVKSFTVQPGAAQTALNINDLSKGNYMVIFENNGTKSVTQVTRQ